MFLISKAVAVAQATINALLAGSQALASPPGPPFTIPLAATVKAVGLVNAATIAATTISGFETGGFPQGQNAVVRVNERGQEAILNAQATSNLGRDAINALNSGAKVGSSGSVSIIIQGSTFNVGNSLSREDRDALEEMDKHNKQLMLAQLKDQLEELGYHRI